MAPMKFLIAPCFATVLIASPLGMTAAQAQDINDSAYDGLKSMISAEVQTGCRKGSPATYSEKAFSLKSPGIVIVRLGAYSCEWEFNNHFFCGARACEVREYAVDGSTITLKKTYLQ